MALVRGASLRNLPAMMDPPPATGRPAEIAPEYSGDASPQDPHPCIGPILRFEGTLEGMVRFAVTRTAAEAPAPLRVRAGGGAPTKYGFEPIGALAGTRFWTSRFRVADDAEEMTIEREGDHPLTVPVARADGPLRIAFASCNGAEVPGAMDALPGGRDEMWRRLARRHAEDPFHLLILGGDQIYADGLWELPTIRAWSTLGRAERYRAPFTEAMREELERHYRNTYAEAFGSPDVRTTLSAVPSMMVWDDHDIVDGWGSRPAAWQASPVAQGLFAVARHAFALTQAGIPPHGSGAFDRAHDYGPARIVAPDLRSTRTRWRVMDEASHAALRERTLSEREHLIIVSSVPLLNADLSPLERLVAPLQRLADLFQDDLRDQWMSYAHRAEWGRTVDLLLERAAAGRRVSVVSGEIHLAARATLRPRPSPSGAGVRRIDQFIASGIAHPPPPSALALLFERFGRRTIRREGADLTLRSLTADGRRFVPERNWLEVELRPAEAPYASVHAEKSGVLPA